MNAKNNECPFKSISSQQPNLDALRKARVGEERKQEDRPIHRGRWVRPSDEANGEYGSHAPKHDVNVVINNGQLARSGRKEFIRTNDMNDESLRHDGLNNSPSETADAGWIQHLKR